MERRVLVEVLELLLIIRAAILYYPAVTDSKEVEAQHIHHTNGRKCNGIELRTLCHTSTDEQTTI